MPTVKAEWTQGDIDRYFKAEAEIKGDVRATSPEYMAAAMSEFVKAMGKAGLSLDNDKFRAMLDEYGKTIRVNQQVYAQISQQQYYGIAARSAARAGLVDGMKDGDVDGMKPAVIKAIHDAIAKAITNAYEVSGE